MQLVDFMNDKLFECLTGQALRSDVFRYDVNCSWICDVYSLYARVFSEVLLHIAAGGDGSIQRQDIECVLETALPVILQRVRKIVIVDCDNSVGGADDPATSRERPSILISHIKFFAKVDYLQPHHACIYGQQWV